jgi:hypothetical protein
MGRPPLSAHSGHSNGAGKKTQLPPGDNSKIRMKRSLSLKNLRLGVTEWRQVEVGTGEEAAEQAGPVLHPPEPGPDQGGELAEIALGEVGQGALEVRLHLLNRVELVGVGREAEHGQPVPGRDQAGHRGADMSVQVVPHDDDGAGELLVLQCPHQVRHRPQQVSEDVQGTYRDVDTPGAPPFLLLQDHRPTECQRHSRQCGDGGQHLTPYVRHAINCSTITGRPHEPVLRDQSATIGKLMATAYAHGVPVASGTCCHLHH